MAVEVEQVGSAHDVGGLVQDDHELDGHASAGEWEAWVSPARTTATVNAAAMARAEPRPSMGTGLLQVWLTPDTGWWELAHGWIHPIPRKCPDEFGRDVVRAARASDAPVEQIAGDFGVHRSALQRWLAQADIDEGRRVGVTTDGRRS